MKKLPLRHMLIALLMLSSVFHFAAAMFSLAGTIALAAAGFGFLLAGLGYFSRADIDDGSPSRLRNATAGAGLIGLAGAGAAIWLIVKADAGSAIWIVAALNIAIALIAGAIFARGPLK